MAGTREGGIKTRDRNLAKDPDYYVKMGKVGGKKGTTGGFYYSKANGLDLHIEAGRKGGKAKKRNSETL